MGARHDRAFGIASVVVVAMLGLSVSSARAQVEGAVEPARVVDLVFAGDAIEASGLAPTLEELLARIEVELRQGPIVVALDPRVVLTPRPDARPAVARIWIELAAGRTTIYLVDGEWERILVRHVPTDGETLDEVGREQVAHIVHAAVEALLAGARIGLTRVEASEQLGVEVPPPPSTEPTPPAEPVAEPPSELAGDVYVGYAPQLFADGLSVRHALMVHASMLVGRDTTRIALSVGLDFWPTTTHESPDLRLDLRSLLIRFEGGVDVELIDGTSLRIGGGLTLDLTAVEPRVIPGSPVMTLAPWDAIAPLLSARVAVHQRIWEMIGLTAGFLLDLDLLDTRYVVSAGEDDRVVVDPWLVRPAFWLGVGGRFR